MGKSATYLDYNASAPLRPEAREAMIASFGAVGNASSIHSHGRGQHHRIEGARDRIAAALGARASGVVFTGGGTEANNLALAFGRDRPVLVSAIEHDSVIRPGIAVGATEIPVCTDGTVDLDGLDRALALSEAPPLVSLMMVNNETGVKQPVDHAAEICRRHGALLHCDAVQALGRVAIDMSALGADMISVSAHKIGGPQGVGALILANDIAPPPVLRGGGQERGRRPGTQNIAGIEGFVAAIDAARYQDGVAEHLAAWRDAMESTITSEIEAVRVIGANSSRVPGVSCLACPGLAAETQVMTLDLAGFSISAGSACSSGTIAPSHVLRAMGLSDALASCAIRVSGGWASCEDEFAAFAAAYVAMVRRIHGAA